MALTDFVFLYNTELSYNQSMLFSQYSELEYKGVTAYTQNTQVRNEILSNWQYAPTYLTVVEYCKVDKILIETESRRDEIKYFWD